VTCYTQLCKPCKVTYITHYLPQGGESSPRGSWGICAPALPEVLTLPPRTTMGSWITTRQLLLHQDAKSSPTRNQASGELGLLMGNVDTHMVPPCIITGVKMYTSRQRPATASWTLSNSFPTIIKCHSYHPSPGYSWQHPHPDVPFASVGDDTTAALTDLAAFFKLKLQHPPSPETRASPANVVPCPNLIPSPTQILNTPIPDRRQMRSQTTIHTQNIPDVPLPPRVVTPRTICASPPRVPTGSCRLSPCNLSQDDFCGMDSAHVALDLRTHHWSQRHQTNAFIHPVTGK
jgi:hypothetical protein